MKIFQKKGILSKAIERDAKNMKKILEDIKTNTYERFYLFYGEEKWTKSTYQDQSGLCYHDHFDMDSNGKKKEYGIS